MDLVLLTFGEILVTLAYNRWAAAMLPCASKFLPSLNNFLASPVAATSTSETLTFSFSATEGGDKATKLVHPAISITLRLETPFCGAKADANESQRIKKDAPIRCSDEARFDLVMVGFNGNTKKRLLQYDATHTSPMRKEDGFWER
jgi:hypothetical protein